MGAFLLLSSAEGWLPSAPEGTPHPTWYPLAYAAKAAVVAGLMICFRATWRDLLPIPRRLGPWLLAGALGLLVFALWIAPDLLAARLGRASLYPRLGGSGARQSFDPTVLPLLPRLAFLAVRLLGLVVLVPVFEELFWRSFVMRLVIDPDDFTRAPVGRVTLPAALITSAAFAAVHPEWLPALATGLLWAWLLARTGSLSLCAFSHAVANLALGVYVLATGEWRYW
jgi:CAAX prenyl protease-like protein